MDEEHTIVIKNINGYPVDIKIYGYEVVIERDNLVMNMTINKRHIYCCYDKIKFDKPNTFIFLNIFDDNKINNKLMTKGMFYLTSESQFYLYFEGINLEKYDDEMFDVINSIDDIK